MKNIFLCSILIMTSTYAFGQKSLDYPFKVEKSGAGNQSILLIPGFASSGEVWDATVKTYKENYTCYTLTMAGFAGVEPSENKTFDNWKNRIVDFIKEKNIENPIIIGHSMGGGLAMAIAADYPKLLKKIVIVDALPCLAALSNPSFEHQENVDCSASIEQITAMSEDQFYQMQKNTIPQLTTNQEMVKTIVEWSVKSDRKTFAEMYCYFSNTDLREKIENIQCPTLILLESYFKNFKPAIEKQYKHLKTANLEYANKGLHFIMYDDKEWYFEQLSNFIENN
ncbi:pimeloyl-ACP methyl ester carboxylesterase [Leeuwenhoekiella aestuarii]|uniref:alpha/beta fold hydrolase n=1 Tax=Leeuwenhoekiella aestuarii TaxID=2249426 RepID=UPI000FFEF293|nr:alpha/beta hydrolase [Leeuwenhoekiella aestuarii]RXG12173.1 pimeloyl-ACP methyl ester carboxylesterase [Leeuwenhoekiella aestuarii]